jgi:hypothetical protein
LKLPICDISPLASFSYSYSVNNMAKFFQKLFWNLSNLRLPSPIWCRSTLNCTLSKNVVPSSSTTKSQQSTSYVFLRVSAYPNIAWIVLVTIYIESLINLLLNYELTVGFLLDWNNSTNSLLVNTMSSISNDSSCISPLRYLL